MQIILRITVTKIKLLLIWSKPMLQISDGREQNVFVGNWIDLTQNTGSPNHQEYY